MFSLLTRKVLVRTQVIPKIGRPGDSLTARGRNVSLFGERGAIFHRVFASEHHFLVQESLEKS